MTASRPQENSRPLSRSSTKVAFSKATKDLQSPIVLLNRAIAEAKVRVPEAAIQDIQDAIESEPLENYALAHAVLGDLELQHQRSEQAARHFQRAISMTLSSAEQSHIASLLEEPVKK
ncbi:MAG: hypothetical protein Fur0032_12430 [Terrimicrobiaceae bacterium]